VWCARLAEWLLHREALWRTLAPDELARAARYRRTEHRERFVLARGLLRVLLARYTGLEPGGLHFAYGPYGKPALASTGGGERLQFNVSHTDEVALYAVSEQRTLGVDVERVRPDLPWARLAGLCFSAREQALLDACAAAEVAALFTAGWTRKEAVAKGLGEGLRCPLAEIEVLPITAEGGAVRAASRDSGRATNWWLAELPPIGGHRAALAAEGSRPRVRCWGWPAEAPWS